MQGLDPEIDREATARIAPSSITGLGVARAWERQNIVQQLRSGATKSSKETAPFPCLSNKSLEYMNELQEPGC